MWKVAICLCLFVAVCSAVLLQKEDDTVTVKIEDGLLRGKIATSIWNRTYHSFRGVPYAQPPIGELRFKSPRPVKPWTGERDATKQGTYCPQSDRPNTNATMSEDCLYLNVYVPQVVASSIPAAGLPVMFWIHGGAFKRGSGISDLYGPDHFMNHSTILVTINCRLGDLGFLFLEHPDVTSNAGMKDQVAALRWVKRNIAAFGGNPDDVTIFGQSSGGGSVEYLLLSPMTTGLFKRAISESGSAMMFAYRKSNSRAAFVLGEALGYNGTDADGLVKFLRSVTAEDIVKVAASQEVDFVTYPVVDAKTQEGSEVFLTDNPENLVISGKKQPVPYITGINSQEGKRSLNGLDNTTLDRYNSNLEMLIPSFINVQKGSAESLEVAAKIKNFYFGNRTISFDTLEQFVHLQSDDLIYPTHRSAVLHAKYGTTPIYEYMFTYEGTLKRFTLKYDIKGPGHAEELPYLFYMSDVTNKPTSDDLKVMRHLSGMWVNFAQSGDPSLHEEVKWTPATKTNHSYLQIDVKLSLHEDMLKERMAFWDQVYDTYNK